MFERKRKNFKTQSSPSVGQASRLSESRVSLKGSGLNHRGDNLLLSAALLLTALGLVMVYSASTYVAAMHGKMDWFYFFRQAKFTVIGLGALLLGARIDVFVYKKYVKLALIFICVVMALQLVTPLGSVIGGTRRWLNLGIISVQTSDIARCLVIIYLARILTDEPEILQRLDKRMLKLLSMIAIPMALTALQPDLSGAILMAFTAGFVLFIGGLKLKHLFGFGSISAFGAYLMMMWNPYQKERLMGFLQQFTDVSSGGDNYQSFQSMLGFGRGGLFGVGLGQSKQKMLFLPEPHTDFIFSIIGEELGLIRSVLILALFLIIVMRAFKAMKNQPERFYLLMGSGLAATIVIYALVNMYVATGLLPVTGLPLPFISSGGTNLVISLWSIGILWNLSRFAGDHG